MTTLTFVKSGDTVEEAVDYWMSQAGERMSLERLERLYLARFKRPMDAAGLTTVKRLVAIGNGWVVRTI